jgi:CRP-like cAMP-binding protein
MEGLVVMPPWLGGEVVSTACSQLRPRIRSRVVASMHNGSEVNVEHIAGIPLFAALAHDERERVASVSRSLRLRVGEVVVHEGEFAFDVYALTGGAADVMRDGERIATLAPGDVFGEMGVVAPGDGDRRRRRNASVVVTAPSEAIAIDGSEFRRLSDEMPALRDAIHATAASRRLLS